MIFCIIADPVLKGYVGGQTPKAANVAPVSGINCLLVYNDGLGVHPGGSYW